MAVPFTDIPSLPPSASPISTLFPNPSDTPVNPPIFDPAWREIILLWLGREEIAIAPKEAFIAALTNFEDECGGFYRYQAYFLAAEGLAEFSTYSQANAIVSQLAQWRFNRPEGEDSALPSTLIEKARTTLRKTDRPHAIAALERFIHNTSSIFDRWLAAYSLGKTYDLRNPTAISTLEAVLSAIQTDSLRIEVAESLGKVDPGNPLALNTLTLVIESSVPDTLRRKAAHRLGKLEPANATAINALAQIIEFSSDKILRRTAIKSLQKLAPSHLVLAPYIKPQPTVQPVSRRRRRQPAQPNLDKITTALVQHLETTTDEASRIRLAGKLGQYIPGHPQAIATLVNYLQTGQNKTQLKRAAEHLRAIALEEQIPNLIPQLKPCCSVIPPHSSPERGHECFNLLWRWSQQLPYPIFHQAWRQP